MRLATRLAAAILGFGFAFAQAGHDDVVTVDPALNDRDTAADLPLVDRGLSPVR